MKYKDYTAEDLIKDENFQEWVFSPTDESNKFWIEFLVRYPGHRERIEEARQFLSAFNIRDKDVFESRIRNLKKRIDQSIDHPDPARADLSPVIETPKRPKFSVKMALFLAVTIGAGFSACYWYFKKDSAHSEKDKAVVATRTAATARGERMAIVMDDGSRIWLNAGTHLSYSGNFGTGSRSVDLDGEAYFEIAAHDKPFLIKTDGMIVSADTGAFRIKAYAADRKTESTLLRGSITISSETAAFDPVALKPGQGAGFVKNTRHITIHNVIAPQTTVGWVDGVLSFGDALLSDIVPVLERWYDVSIQISPDSSPDCRFTVKMDNQNIGEALETLKSSGGITYRMEGREIFIVDKLCHDQFIK